MLEFSLQVSNCIKLLKMFKGPRGGEYSFYIYIYIASTERRGRAEIDTEAFVWGFRIAAPRAQIWAATPKMLRTKGKKNVL